jgi:hypothetical protein
MQTLRLEHPRGRCWISSFRAIAVAGCVEADALPVMWHRQDPGRVLAAACRAGSASARRPARHADVSLASPARQTARLVSRYCAACAGIRPQSCVRRSWCARAERGRDVLVGSCRGLASSAALISQLSLGRPVCRPTGMGNQSAPLVFVRASPLRVAGGCQPPRLPSDALTSHTGRPRAAPGSHCRRRR